MGDGRRITHAAILEVASTDICGSDRHRVRGRTAARHGPVLGHEINGEAIEVGADAEEGARTGNLALRFGQGWATSPSFHTGQTPTLRYNRQPMQAILHDRPPIAAVVDATVIPLEQAAEGYGSFDDGATKTFVLDPHGLLAA